MLRLRPAKAADIEKLFDWIPKDEDDFIKWSAGKFDFPVTRTQLGDYFKKYENDGRGFIMTALDSSGNPVGQVLMSLADYQSESIRFGFIIVDPEMRGRGYGREMMQLACRYAFDILGMKKASLGVFESNPGAHFCYLSAGFCDKGASESVFVGGREWKITEMEAKA